MDKYVPVTINVPMQDLLDWFGIANLKIKDQEKLNAFMSSAKFRRDLGANLLQAWELMNEDDDQMDNVFAVVPEEYFETED